MGYEFSKRPHARPHAAGALQTITLSGVSTAAAGTAIQAHTETALITSTGTGAGHEVSLEAGRMVGSVLNVLCLQNSTVPVTILLESTSVTLFGSTNNAVTFSTSTGVQGVTLQKTSTSQWALLGTSTNLEALGAASTGTV